MKKLPLSYDNQLNGECWTFYKFSILNTAEIAKPWLATHIEFYINENMCGGYGDYDGEYYRMRYYSDILSMQRISVSNTTSDKALDIIHGEIEKGRYIILYLNFNRFYNIEGISLHELLIYGYDDEKKIYHCPFLINGKFKEVEVPYDLVQVAYDDARKLYIEDGWQLLVNRSYYFGITSLQIRDDYRNDNWVADYIDKIDHELHGKRIIQVDVCSKEQTERIIYTGNACLDGLSSFLKKTYEDSFLSETMSWRLLRTFKMMYDYRRIFISSIEWFIETINCKNEALFKVLAEYEECANNVKNCYLMLYKYLLKKDFHLIECIIHTLEKLQLKERSVLLNYRELIWPYYYDMNGVPMPPDD